MSALPPFKSFGTTAVHAGQDPEDNAAWAVIPPISMASTFKQPSPGVTQQEFDYSRAGNPTRKALETGLAGICGAKHAFAFASGLAGTVSILQMLKSGDHVVAMNDLYGGTNRLFRRVMSKFNLEFSFVDARVADNIHKALKPNTKLVWIETPSNPLLSVTDIRAVAAITKRAGVLLVVDNTFMSPYFQRPLALGADIEFASCTKYLNGHSDCVMGMAATNSDTIAEQLKFLQLASGGIPSPFDCFLVNRGLKTLHLRMKQHETNAFAVARFLESHPGVLSVLYPGLPSHPGHAVAKSQCTGFSGMVSFRLRGGLEESKVFLQSCKVFTLAESLGGVESLAELPAIMTHASIAAPERAALGITDSLLRLSCGVEDTADLLDDLAQALAKALAPAASKTPAPAAAAPSNGTYSWSEPAAPVVAASATVTAAAAAAAPAVATAKTEVVAATARPTTARPASSNPILGDDTRPQTSSGRRHPPGGQSSFTLG